MPETQAQYKARILRHVAGREPLPLLTAAPDTLAALLAAAPPALCTRRPTPEETAEVAELLSKDSPNRAAVIQDLLWAMLSSVEFRFVH